MLGLLIFILMAGFGYLLINLVVRNMRFLERLALSYLLGVGITTLLMFFYSWAGIKITSISVFALLILLIICLGAMNKFLNRKIYFGGVNIIERFTKFKWYEKVLSLAIALVLLTSLITSIYYPVTVWDALALYDFRAKVIAQIGYFTQIAGSYEYFPTYPLLTSLIHTIVYLAKGNNPQFTYSLNFLAFTILIFSFMRKYVSRFISLFFTLLIISDPILFTHSPIAYTNLPYTVYFVIGLLYLFYALTKDRLGLLFISSLLIGMSTWVRNTEPFWITGILFVVAYSIYKKKIYPTLVFLLPFLIIQQPWRIFQAGIYGTSYSTSSQFVAVGKTLFLGNVNWAQITEVLNYVFQNILLPWKYIFPVLVIALSLHAKNNLSKNALVFLTMIVVNFSALLMGVYFFSLNFPDWKVIADSAARMSMFFPPLIICYAVIVLADVYKSGYKTREIKK